MTKRKRKQLATIAYTLDGHRYSLRATLPVVAAVKRAIKRTERRMEDVEVYE